VVYVHPDRRANGIATSSLSWGEPHGAVALDEGVGMTVERRSDLFELGTSESAT
jgi:hypothetical protein